VSYDRPDVGVLAELEELLRHLGSEASSWRRRSLKAESELDRLRTESGALGGPELLESRRRVVALEVENEELRRRIEASRRKVAVLVERLAFLERETVGGVS